MITCCQVSMARRYAARPVKPAFMDVADMRVAPAARQAAAVQSSAPPRLAGVLAPGCRSLRGGVRRPPVDRECPRPPRSLRSRGFGESSHRRAAPPDPSRRGAGSRTRWGSPAESCAKCHRSPGPGPLRGRGGRHLFLLALAPVAEVLDQRLILDVIPAGTDPQAQASAACLATSAVWRCGKMITPVTSSIVAGRAARYPSVTKGSWNMESVLYGTCRSPNRAGCAPRTPDGGGRSWRWLGGLK